MTANRLDACDAAARIRDRRLTSEDLVGSCLDRIRQREADVLAWSHLDRDLAISQARACDQSPGAGGALHGIPVGIKDVIDTCDMPSEYGSPIYAGHRPRSDSACVTLLRNAGAVILGKTQTAEFASTRPPQTRHPRDPSRTPGGSSSGSAAAVADFMVPLSVGTQTGGSIIRPAAYCGVVGFKPSFGRVNRAGIKFSAESMDTIGGFARSVRDISLLAHVLCSQPIPMPTQGRKLRVRVLRTEQWSSASEDAREILESAAQVLSARGHACTANELPAGFAALHAAHATVMNFEIARSSAWEFRNHRNLLSPEFSERVESGMRIGQDAYASAQRLATEGRQLALREFAHVDLWMTLSAPGEAPTGLSSTGLSTFNKIWTLLKLPCVHLPVGKGRNGLPLGIQLIATRDADLQLLADACLVEEALRDSQNIEDPAQ